MSEQTGSINGEKPPSGANPAKKWVRWLVLILIAVAVLILVFLIAGAILPRWWAQSIGNQVDGKMTNGIAWGLFYGFAFTLAPILVLWQARYELIRWPLKIIIALVAVVLAIPNLLTLGIVLGNSGAAHAGERIMDVDAPAFRGASLAGALVAGLIGIALIVLVALIGRSNKQVRIMKRQAKADAKLAKQEAKKAKEAGDL